MNRSAHKGSIAVMTALLALVFGCGDPIPLKEMATARLEISKSMTVKADKYAPVQLKDATDLLMRSHDDIKADKFDDAKKNADAAFAKAQEAYAVAVPLIAKDAIDVAVRSVQDADDSYASELANADFDAAKAKLAKAQSQYDSKDFYESYKTALDADNQAKTARNLALSKKETLNDAIADVKETISRAEKLDAQSASPQKLALAKENLAKAQSCYESMKLKEGFVAIETAKVNADGAYIESLKAFSLADMDKAAALIGAVEQGKGAAAVKDEIAGAKELLSTAKNLHDSGKYNESIQASDEAKRIAVSAAAVAARAAADDEAVSVTAKAATADDAKKNADKPAVGASNSENDIYVVQYFKNRARDCLWFIAQKFYNNPRQWKNIYDVNRDIIKNPDLIRPGWKLKIPRCETKKAASVKDDAVKPEPQQEISPVKAVDPEKTAEPAVK